jgi:hypothetical protein
MHVASPGYMVASILKPRTRDLTEPCHCTENFLTLAMKNRLILAGLILISLSASALLPARIAAQSPDEEQGQRQSLQDLEAHGIRGTVTAIAGDTVTVKTEQGEVY